MANRRIDWDSLRADYLVGTFTNVQLCKKYRCDESSIRKRAKAEGWVRGSHKEAVADKIKEKVASLPMTESRRKRILERVIELESDAGVRLLQSHRESFLFWRDITDRLAEAMGEVDIHKGNIAEVSRAINTSIDALGKLVKMERQAYALDDGDKGSEHAEWLNQLEGSEKSKAI